MMHTRHKYTILQILHDETLILVFGLGPSGVMSVCVVSLDYLCKWPIQVSIYCARQIPVHLRCTQCSILLQLIDICFVMCICLWQIPQIQTFLCVVVGPGLVSTSPAFMRRSDIPRVRMAGLPQNGKLGPIDGGGRGRHINELQKLLIEFVLISSFFTYMFLLIQETWLSSIIQKFSK